MKKFGVLIILILTFNFLFSISRKQAMDKWMLIVSESDPRVKLLKIEELQTEYGNQNDQMTELLYVNMVVVSYQIADYKKTIDYGEKALTALPNIEISNKLKIYLSLANSYYVTRVDLEKSFDYATQLINLVKPFQEASKASRLDVVYIAPALRLQAKILFERPEKTAEALNKAFESYDIDHSEGSINLIKALANEASKQNKFDEALVAYEKIYQIKPDVESARVIGYLYGKKGDDLKTIEFLEKSYQFQKSAKIAFDLGILYNKAQDIDNAIKYFAASFVLYEKSGNDPENMAKTQNILQHLYANVKAKDITNQEEKDRGYQDILAAARLAIEENK